ncbi:MAG: hypothetical protein HOL80_00335 [Candidatus Magasanikbacteria bacterium]|jgi:hypothetical protein|nr:hypothetical protein [Candidatus Magasanikbacteria bacterium]MBT5262328.1 hypothetical protein [Candidatus Magasanikbacteria bacterium]MBT5820409.1 hypothetical protein [Candidatus Magasanikbacteria bacterium]MBT6294304.1 hypothetical protein [Candidatus Magasanikbacteria bacterium]
MEKQLAKKKKAVQASDPHKEIMAQLNALKNSTQEQKKYLTQVAKEVHKINRRTHMFVIMGYVKVGLVLLPIVLGMVYLPAFVQKVYKTYNPIFQGISGLSNIEQTSPGFSRADLERIIKTLPR